MQSDLSGTSLLFDIGCGIGNWLFEFLVLEGRSDSRMVGVDISKTAVETARTISEWMGDERFSFAIGGLAGSGSAPIDCGGRDVVFFSVSVLNKIKILDMGIFQNLLTCIRNHGRVRFVHVESFGWRVYRDRKLNGFFLEMDQTINDIDAIKVNRCGSEQFKNHRPYAAVQTGQ